MRRVILAWLVLTAPILTLLTAAGCEPETKSVQRTEKVQETEPKPVSPGQEVIE